MGNVTSPPGPLSQKAERGCKAQLISPSPKRLFAQERGPGGEVCL